MKKLITMNSGHLNPNVKSIRAQIEKDIKAFKKAGGKIEQIPFGKSANKVFEFVIHTGDA